MEKSACSCKFDAKACWLIAALASFAVLAGLLIAALTGISYIVSTLL